MLERRDDVRLKWGVATHAQAHQTECGDAFTVQPTAAGFLIAAVDGLGHGADAARAARRAVDTINRSAEGSPQEILRECHRALVGTRGAAISIAQVDLAQGSLDWLGVGNVEGVVVSPAAHPGQTRQSESLVVRGGVIGYELPNLVVNHLPFGLGAVLVFATDGIKQGFGGEIDPGRNPQWTADQIMSRYDRGTDDALVLVVQNMWGGSDRSA